MRILVCSAIMLFTASVCSATTFETIVGGPGPDRGVFVSPTSDGGYIAVGVTTVDHDEDVYLVKLDAEGEVAWTRSHGGELEDNGWCVRETADGYIVSGFTKSFGSGGYDFYLLKTDLSGEAIWFKTYGGERDDRCWGLDIAPDGGFVLVGETESYGAGERDCYLVRVDADGKELWSETYGGSEGDRCFSVATAGDEGFMIAGQTYSEGAGDRDAYVLKTMKNGELDWSRSYGGEASDVAHSITGSADGQFLVTGYTTSLAESGDDPYLIMIDTSGEAAWTQVLAMEGIHHTLTGEQAEDGGFYLVGFTRHPNGPPTGLLVKADEAGELDWSRDISMTPGGETFGYTVRATADGGCVFIGHCKGLDRNNQMLIVKLADSGE